MNEETNKSAHIDDIKKRLQNVAVPTDNLNSELLKLKNAGILIETENCEYKYVGGVRRVL
jgi:hypothetical protein